MLIFAIFSLGVAFFGIIGAPGASFGLCIIIFACAMYVFESVAEALSVWFEDPILGMLQCMNFWFGAFLFGGFLISQDDLYWPFELFYYIMPYQYHLRSFVYNYFSEISWEACDPVLNPQQAVCVNSTNADDIIDAFGRIYPLISSDDQTGFDIVILIIIGTVFKLMFIAGVLMKTSATSKFHAA
uniref:ABC-2 type transporter domain-containing protein n=1 Tax=Entomoneis paludosa TaxID=265537 RepID=A0A7S2YIE4_9STRA